MTAVEKPYGTSGKIGGKSFKAHVQKLKSSLAAAYTPNSTLPLTRRFWASFKENLLCFLSSLVGLFRHTVLWSKNRKLNVRRFKSHIYQFTS